MERLDSARAGRISFVVVGVLCAGVTLADLFYDKHAHYAWEHGFGFNGWYGFVSCFVLVLAARELRRILKRDEDYYDRRDR